MNKINVICLLQFLTVVSGIPFITIKNAKFYAGNLTFVPVGFNSYWLGIDEQFNYPSTKRIEEQFKIAKAMSATTIRSHTLGHSTGNVKSLLLPNGLINAKAWKPIDKALFFSRKYNIRLIVPFTDNYWWYNGNYGDYADRRGLSKSEFWSNRQLISDFKTYIRTWLNHVNQYTGVAYKNDPWIMMLETGNELGNIRNDGNTVPPKEWISEITAYIRRMDKNHLILDGSDESLGKSDNFNIPSIDVFSRHFYEEDSSGLHKVASKAAARSSPLIVGEYGSRMSESWLLNMEKEPNVQGTFFWSMYGHDDNGNWIRHDDGFTQYYGDSQSERDLIRLTNHIRRMRGMKIISSLPKINYHV